MTNKIHPSRRWALGQLAFLGTAAVLPTPVSARIMTPEQAEGPFYPRKNMRFTDQDNDLVKVASALREAGGEIILLKGRVTSPDGTPASAARIEIWQVDSNGRYLHSGESGKHPRDPNFQGFGFAIADTDGRYVFRTIKPIAYPGRAPHIHVKVFHGGMELTTQFYIDGHPLNERDVLWRRMSGEERGLVAMRFAQSTQDEEATVDIRL
ncbi:MAG: protocatechuate 3,4-dioxygenase [Stappiaceae bacterium]